ncbi:MAG: flippase-like domain-containing protein [Deltaproteobacteria bacterium]|nr:flippase-like domain-containing protein [Deltaproteobacteria bacterium]
MKSSLNWRMVLAVSLTLVLLAWFVSGLDGDALLAELSRASWSWLALASVAMLTEWFLRGVRWYVVLHAVHPEVMVRDLVSATFVGAALNTLLPLRGGDVARPGVVYRRSGVPFATALSSSLVERFFDLFGMVGVVVLTLVLVPTQEPGGLLGTLQSWGYLFAALSVGGLVVAGVLANGLGHRPAKAIIERLPRRARPGAREAFERTVSGLSVVRRPTHFAEVVVLTGLVWLATLASLVMTFWAVGVNLPMAGALFVQAALLIAIALPQAPGFLGVFQVVMEQTTTLWGASEGQAQALALMYWVVSYVPVTVIGLIAVWREGLDLLRPRKVMSGIMEEDP